MHSETADLVPGTVTLRIGRKIRVDLILAHSSITWKHDVIQKTESTTVWRSPLLRASDTCGLPAPDYSLYRGQGPRWGWGVSPSLVQLPGTVYLTPCELQLSPPWRLLDIWTLTCLVYRGSASEDYLWRALWIYSSSSSSWHVALPLEQHRATATGSTYSNVGEIWTSGYWDTRSYRQRDTYMPITIRRPSTESEVKTPASFNI